MGEILDCAGTTRVHRHGAGRFTLTAHGPQAYAPAVRRALERAARVRAGFDRDQFWALLREADVPNAAIAEIVETVTVEDDVYAVP